MVKACTTQRTKICVSTKARKDRLKTVQYKDCKHLTNRKFKRLDLNLTNLRSSNLRFYKRRKKAAKFVSKNKLNLPDGKFIAT